MEPDRVQLIVVSGAASEFFCIVYIRARARIFQNNGGVLQVNYRAKTGFEGLLAGTNNK